MFRIISRNGSICTYAAGAVLWRSALPTFPKRSDGQGGRRGDDEWRCAAWGGASIAVASRKFYFYKLNHVTASCLQSKRF